MTTTLDAKIVPKVLLLIAKVGTNLTYTVNVGTYDPTTGIRSSSTTDHTRKSTPPSAVSATPGLTLTYGQGLVQMGDVETFIAASGLAFTPVLGMVVVFASQSWHIVSLGKIYSGDDLAVWRLALRR